MSRLYNENSKQSILEYAQQLEGKTLRDILPNDVVANMSTDELGNKGRYGHKIEKYYFDWQIKHKIISLIYLKSLSIIYKNH